MKKETSTYSDQKIEPLTFEDIKKCADRTMKQEEKVLPKGLGWFTKLMNRFGWHRKYEIIVIDKDKFIFNKFL